MTGHPHTKDPKTEIWLVLVTPRQMLTVDRMSKRIHECTGDCLYITKGQIKPVVGMNNETKAKAIPMYCCAKSDK